MLKYEKRETSEKMRSGKTDIPSEGITKGKSWKRIAAMVLLSLIFIVFVLGAGAFIYLKKIMNDPESQFAPNPAATTNPNQANMKDVVNILLVGLDYTETRSDWTLSNTYNTDVMMVLAVDFNNKTVDMISLPRDSYVQMPNAFGIYKLNAAMKCGGGYPQGFDEVLTAAQWMLGDIPVDYYYGVTMPVMRDLVNAIGGVDYDVEFDFAGDSHSYRKGLQHMNGQAVLDYIRVRKNIDIEESGDLNRIDRQKKMLLAIFQKMKQQNLWSKLPGILSSLKNQIATNTTIGQTTALASLAISLNEGSIRMHSMGGTIERIFHYDFCLTDQAARVALIQQVYGVTVPAYDDYSYDGAMKRWASMTYDVYQPNASTLIDYVQGLIDHGTLPSVKPTAKPSPTPSTVNPTTSPSSTPEPSNTSTGRAVAPASNVVYQKFLEVKSFYEKVMSLKAQGKDLLDALEDLKGACLDLASYVNHPLKSNGKWAVTYENQFDVY